jgi:hypothetical protein
VYSTTFKSVIVYSFIGPIDVEDVNAAFSAFDDMRRATAGSPCAGLAVLGPAGRLPDDETRRRVAEWQLEMAPHLAASALVVDTEGFVASAVRLALASVRLLERRGYRERVFGNIPEAAKWVAGFVDLGVSEESRLVEVARALRTEHQVLRADG